MCCENNDNSPRKPGGTAAHFFPPRICTFLSITVDLLPYPRLSSFITAFHSISPLFTHLLLALLRCSPCVICCITPFFTHRFRCLTITGAQVGSCKPVEVNLPSPGPPSSMLLEVICGLFSAADGLLTSVCTDNASTTTDTPFSVCTCGSVGCSRLCQGYDLFYLLFCSVLT